jgi:hypothetical protein
MRNSRRSQLNPFNRPPNIPPENRQKNHHPPTKPQPQDRFAIPGRRPAMLIFYLHSPPIPHFRLLPAQFPIHLDFPEILH